MLTAIHQRLIFGSSFAALIAALALGPPALPGKLQ
jgi:hypothetical protein